MSHSITNTHPLRGAYPFSGIIGVEIELQPNVYSYAFPDVAILRGKKIRHIVIANPFISISPSGKELFTFYESAPDNVFFSFTKRGTQEFVIDKLGAHNLFNPTSSMLLLDNIFDLPMSRIDIDRSEEITESSIYLLFLYEEPLVSNPVPQPNNRISFFDIQIERSRTFFQENHNLRNNRFESILFVPVKKNPSGVPAADESIAARTFLTLQRNNLQFFQQVPVNFFSQASNYFLYQLQNIVFDFPNSFIDVVNFDGEERGKTLFFNCIASK